MYLNHMLNNIGKKAILAVIFVCLFCAQPAAKAWAAIGDYAAFYTVASSGSTSATSEFTLDSKPWLYLKFNTTGDVVNSVTWSSPTVFDIDTSAVVVENLTSTYSEYWISMSDADWNTYAATGEWNVAALSRSGLKGNYTYYIQDKDFTVTPEPLSCVLFLTGGGLLAVLKRKRKAVKA